MATGPWWRIGWRNLGRRRRRTALTAGALALAFMTVVVMVGWVEGLITQMVNNGTGLLSGQIQVQDAEYLPERSLHTTLGGDEGTDVSAILAALVDDPAIPAASARAYAGALISTGDATAAGLVMGVEAGAEMAVTRLLDNIVRGDVPRAGRREVVLGAEMVRKLDVDLGDEVVMVSSAADGSLGNDLYTVRGVFETGISQLDRGFAVMPLGELQALLALDSARVHEVAAAVVPPWSAPEAAERVAARLAERGIDVRVRPWTEVHPFIVDYAQLSRAWFWILEFIVFGMAAFGVANTMLMATFERRREFALMMALGTRPTGVIRSLIYEGVTLGVVGLGMGVALTGPIMIWFHEAPPDLTALVGGFSFAGAFVRPVLFVEYSLPIALWTAVFLFLTSVSATAYPALKAARTPPADTLQGRR